MALPEQFQTSTPEQQTTALREGMSAYLKAPLESRNQQAGEAMAQSLEKQSQPEK